MRDESGGIIGIQGATRDITERKHTEEALRMSEERFSAAFRSSPDAFFLSSVPEGRIIESNTTASRLTGYTAEEMLGRTTTELGLWSHPAAREEYTARVQRDGRVLDFEAEFRTPDGPIDGLISGEIIQLTSGPYFLSIVRDITERKRAAEALITQNRLLEEGRQRLSAQVEEKSRFVATVSHELRTPLAVVLGFASELCARAGVLPTSEVAEFANLIKEGCAAANNLVEDLLTAARIDIGPIALAPEATDLDTAVLAVAAEPETASHIRLKSLELPGTGTVAWADPQRVRQIIRNLLGNAGRHGGPHLSVVSGIYGDSTVVFCRVVDDGPGVPELLLDSLFLPYQHGARDPGLTESVGLGLYLSRNLARLMGGDLTYRRDGASTVFELTLPGTQVAAAA
jgi:PAS domain S-box-containing protein